MSVSRIPFLYPTTYFGALRFFWHLPEKYSIQEQFRHDTFDSQFFLVQAVHFLFGAI